MKLTITGFSKEGLFFIGLVLAVSIGFYSGMEVVIKSFNLESQIETAAFNSYSSALSGCIQISKAKNEKNWKECVVLANAVASDTREILKKEPVKIFKEDR